MAGPVTATVRVVIQHVDLLAVADCDITLDQSGDQSVGIGTAALSYVHNGHIPRKISAAATLQDGDPTGMALSIKAAAGDELVLADGDATWNRNVLTGIGPGVRSAVLTYRCTADLAVVPGTRTWRVVFTTSDD